MKTHSAGRLQAAIAAALLAMTAAAPAAADSDHPTVVELYQSQGCSSCPPADANVMALSSRPDILMLSFGVTYWDQLGWKDTFASPLYTERQQAYARAFHRTEVFTPEVIVNGHGDSDGLNKSALESLIRHEGRTGTSPALDIKDDVVSVGAGSGTQDGDVWLVRYDPNIVQVPISRGENSGRTLPHKNVVKELLKLGSWSGHPQSFHIPQAARGGLREAVLVQDGAGGAILAAARN